MATNAIVCGVDGSEQAHLALEAASVLAERLGADLVVVHVAPDPAVPGVSAAPAGLLRVAAEEEAAARGLVDGMLAELGIEDAEACIVFGSDPGVAIRRIAEERDAGLVVVGARGRGRIASAVLGSVSSDVLAHGPCPVLVVPADHGKLGLLER